MRRPPPHSTRTILLVCCAPSANTSRRMDGHGQGGVRTVETLTQKVRRRVSSTHRAPQLATCQTEEGRAKDSEGSGFGLNVALGCSRMQFLAEQGFSSFSIEQRPRYVDLSGLDFRT